MKMKLNFLQEVSEEKKSLFCFSTALILLLSLIYFGVVPLFEEAVLAKRECVKINEQVKIYEAFSKMGNYLQIEQEQIKKLNALEKHLPKNLQQEVVMSELHSVAESSGVKLKALRQINKERFKRQSIVLYLEVDGNYERLVKFLRAVETEGSFKNLQEFTAKGDEKNGSLEVSTVVAAYNN